MNISAINWAAVGNYAKRGLKLYPNFVFGTGQDVFAKTLKSSYKAQKFDSFSQQLKNALKASEKNNKALIEKNGGFLKNTWKQIKSLPKSATSRWNAAERLAGKLGKTGLSKSWFKCKGAMSAIGKRMPLLGSLMILAFELPNIFKATKNEGIVSGAAETVKAGARLGAGMACAAIGQTIIPIPLVGGLIGWMAGDWLMSKVVGKSYSEKKAATEEAAQAQAAQSEQAQDPSFNGALTQMPGDTTNNATNPFNPSLAAMQQQLYNSGNSQNPMDQDFMYKAYGLNKIG